MKVGEIYFVVNLLQDINVLRPLVYIAAKDLNLKTNFMVSAAFRKRDKSMLWQHELNEIANDTNTPIHDFENEYQALKVLQKAHGTLIAASESHLDAHKEVRDLFRSAPSQYVKITLQHGFECVGFLQSQDQNLAHGKNITFAADIICGWCQPERLISIAPSQRYKLRVTGPSSLLVAPTNTKEITLEVKRDNSNAIGLVCENMHSPRLNVAGNFKTHFFEIFESFCIALGKEKRSVTLRPHPGGQYVIKNLVPLPTNALLENRPIYQVDLSNFAYGISAPSSVLIDMVLAGIPTAVWQDRDGLMDLGNYEGLTTISTIDDWLDFTHRAENEPEFFLERQQAFLRKQKLLVEKSAVYKAFTTMLQAVTSLKRPINLTSASTSTKRILFVSNSHLPTLQLSFIKPLAPLVDAGAMNFEFLSEEQMKLQEWRKEGFETDKAWIRNLFERYQPELVVFCRYSGPYADYLLDLASQQKIASIYHIDDDLLGIPMDIGADKHRYHNEEKRLDTVRLLLNQTNLIYASTYKLKQHLESLNVGAPVEAGAIYCSGTVINTPEQRPVRKIGYMASADHSHNLTNIIGALVRLLRKHPNLKFEFFGSIHAPSEFAEFGERICQAPPISDYEQFLQKFAEYHWDIGICPLSPIHFNKMKANTKWVEYTSVGAAVVASKGTVYDECCADGCGLLASSEEEWFATLDSLVSDPLARFRQVMRAQKKLQEEYSIERLRNQVLDVFMKAYGLSQNSS